MQSRKYTDLPLHFQPIISKMDMRRQTLIDNGMQPHLVAHVHQVRSLCICLIYHLQRLRQGLMGMMHRMSQCVYNQKLYTIQLEHFIRRYTAHICNVGHATYAIAPYR